MQVERIDDIPVIWNQLESLEISNLVNAHFPVHGNRQGASLGTLCCVFLTYILSESDHRLSHVEDWYSTLANTLGYLTKNTSLNRLDFTDDRLGSLLDAFSDDTHYESFETASNRHIISVYSLNKDTIEDKTVHLDATIAQSFKESSDLFSIGYAKHRRKDLVQVKTMLSCVGGLSMPLCVEVVNGATADDVLYLPMIERVEKTLQSQGLLFVGDSKLGSIGNRCAIAQKAHYYLTPLNKVQLSDENLQALLVSNTDYISLGENGEIKAFETMVTRQEDDYQWKERLITAYSPGYGQSQITQFDKQLAQSIEQIESLTVIKQRKTPIKTQEELQQKIAQICHKYKTTAFLDIQIEVTSTQTHVRKYKDKPAGIRSKESFKVIVFPKNEVIKAHKDTLGWRVYATNAPKELLDTDKVIQTYKDEFKVEYRFDQLHNKTAALMPIYLQKDNRIKALIRILMIAIKILSIIQYQARENLKKTQSQVKELFPGNPNRKTNQPTAEMILRAFCNISLVIVELKDNTKHIEVSKLSSSQIYLLKILNMEQGLYQDFAQFFFLKHKLSET
jgi:transposase